MTESEAKKKWCPFSRELHRQNAICSSSVTSINRDIYGKPSPGSCCLGSACMAWHKEGHCLLIGLAIPSTWEDRRIEAEKNA